VAAIHFYQGSTASNETPAQFTVVDRKPRELQNSFRHYKEAEKKAEEALRKELLKKAQKLDSVQHKKLLESTKG